MGLEKLKYCLEFGHDINSAEIFPLKTHTTLFTPCLLQEDGSWTDIPRCIEHEPGKDQQIPGLCPGISGYCSEGYLGQSCKFNCAYGKPIDSVCTSDGTWFPYPTCTNDVRETQDGCNPCPGPNGRPRNRPVESSLSAFVKQQKVFPQQPSANSRVSVPTFAGNQAFGPIAAAKPQPVQQKLPVPKPQQSFVPQQQPQVRRQPAQSFVPQQPLAQPRPTAATGSTKKLSLFDSVQQQVSKALQRSGGGIFSNFANPAKPQTPSFVPQQRQQQPQIKIQPQQQLPPSIFREDIEARPISQGKFIVGADGQIHAQPRANEEKLIIQNTIPKTVSVQTRQQQQQQQQPQPRLRAASPPSNRATHSLPVFEAAPRNAPRGPGSSAGAGEYGPFETVAL